MSCASRRVRIVCVSDTHNASPKNGCFKLPPGDVLVHAGDLTKQGSYDELKKTLDWIEESKYQIKIVVAGNHDITLDPAFYAEHGRDFHNQDPQDPQKCLDLVKGYSSIAFLNHEYATFDLHDAQGSISTLRVFGSPYSPGSGRWAFGYDAEGRTDMDSGADASLWDDVPLNTDVVVTHTPPKYHCDEKNGRSVGCESLRRSLWRVRPSLAICGHVHEARGAERVHWDLSNSNVRHKEDNCGYWEDPGAGTQKQSLLILSSRAGQSLINSGPWELSIGRSNDADRQHGVHKAAEGLGGELPSGRCDLEALEGRLGREETCIVNAAIMASSWPYKASSMRYNKPIVIEIDLPVHSMESHHEL